MGEIVGAGLVSHVPTMVLPQPVRLALNEGREISLVPGLQRLRAEVFDRLRPDTVVVLDTHWFTTVEFVVTAHARRSGRYTSEELPRGMRQVPFDYPGDPELAHALAKAAAGRDDTWILASDDDCLPVHYPTINLLGFLQGDARWVSIGICQTAERDDFLLVGRLLAEAVASLDRRVVVLASGGMSHRFWPLRELRRHEASDPSHVVSDQARDYDRRVLSWWEAGDHAAVIDFAPEYAAVKPEGMFGHYLMMIGALGAAACCARGVRYSDYENAVGTAQVHVWFERPSGGWTAAEPRTEPGAG